MTLELPTTLNKVSEIRENMWIKINGLYTTQFFFFIKTGKNALISVLLLGVQHKVKHDAKPGRQHGN